jgi:transcriptional regulator with XRE-family HTH domain
MAQISKLNELFSENPAFQRGRERAQTYIRIGTELRQLREDAGLSQKELADKTGLDQGDISRLEAGKWGKRGISYDVLSRVLPVFGLRVTHEVKPLSGVSVTRGGIERAVAMTELLHSK